jgi:hypothetical protein
MAMTKNRVSEVKPYVERAMRDEELRNSVLEAFSAAKEVYGELVGNRGVTGIASRVASDKEIQDNLRKAVDELRHAADRIQGKEDHSTRNAMLLMSGITIGILFNPMTGPATRRWLKDRVFGSGEEFSYGGSPSGNGPPAAA